MKDRKEFRGLVIWLSILLFFVIGVQGTPVSIKHVKVSQLNYRVMFIIYGVDNLYFKIGKNDTGGRVCCR